MVHEFFGGPFSRRWVVTKNKQVWVEIEVFFNSEPRVLRIFRNKSHAMSVWALSMLRAGIGLMDRAAAVKSIRKQIFHRSEGFCEFCGSIVLESSGHMHEQKHRGKGGEISLENSVFICATCHQHAHADRNPRFSSSKPPETGGFVTDNIKDGYPVKPREPSI